MTCLDQLKAAVEAEIEKAERLEQRASLRFRAGRYEEALQVGAEAAAIRARLAVFTGGR